jgi:nonribosomal peptide synthetase DhbF
VELAAREVVQDARALADTIRNSDVTVMQATPTLWQSLVSDDAVDLGRLTMLVGGEALPKDLANALRIQGRSLRNLYGPTETTIWSAATIVSDEGTATPPIGRPIWNTRVYVLDGCLEAVPVGVVGELYIAAQVWRGAIWVVLD